MTDPHSQHSVLAHKRALLAQFERSVRDCTAIADSAHDPARIDLYRGEAARAQRQADDLRAEITDLLNR